MQEFIGAKLPVDISKEELEIKAHKGYGTTYSWLVQRGIKLMMSFSPPFYKKLEDHAEALSIEVGKVVENTIWRVFAEREARKQVWGPSGELLPEFSVMGDTMLSGLELFNYLKDWFIQKEEGERVEALLRQEETGILTDDEKAFLVKKRRGTTWLLSEECAREQSEQKEAIAKLTSAQQEALKQSREKTKQEFLKQKRGQTK